MWTRVPRDMKEGAYALGMTRWETVRGVVLPHAGPGIAAAVILGLGRAIGEATAATWRWVSRGAGPTATKTYTVGP